MRKLKILFEIPFEGESVGYTVRTMEKDFPISNFPLEQTEFLYDSKQGRAIKGPFISRSWNLFLIFGLKQRKLSDHVLVQAEPFGNFALSSTTALKIIKKARDRFVDEKNTLIDYSMFHFWKGSSHFFIWKDFVPVVTFLGWMKYI